MELGIGARDFGECIQQNVQTLLIVESAEKEDELFALHVRTGGIENVACFRIVDFIKEDSVGNDHQRRVEMKGFDETIFIAIERMNEVRMIKHLPVRDGDRYFFLPGSMGEIPWIEHAAGAYDIRNALSAGRGGRDDQHGFPHAVNMQDVGPFKRCLKGAEESRAEPLL